jgi:hypothetical protein
MYLYSAPVDRNTVPPLYVNNKIQAMRQPVGRLPRMQFYNNPEAPVPYVSCANGSLSIAKSTSTHSSENEILLQTAS